MPTHAVGLLFASEGPTLYYSHLNLSIISLPQTVIAQPYIIHGIKPKKESLTLTGILLPVSVKKLDKLATVTKGDGAFAEGKFNQCNKRMKALC